MNKCVIPKKRRTRSQTASSCLIRISAEQYEEILNLCDATGRSISDIATRLLEFALERVEITDKEDTYERN